MRRLQRGFNEMLRQSTGEGLTSPVLRDDTVLLGERGGVNAESEEKERKQHGTIDRNFDPFSTTRGSGGVRGAWE